VKRPESRKRIGKMKLVKVFTLGRKSEVKTHRTKT